MSKLALFGGTPVRTKPFGGHPLIDNSDIGSVVAPFVNNCFSGFRAGQEDGGPCVKEFEEKMRSMVGTKHAIAFDTWSNGLFSILLALGVRPGDEVVLPAYTMTACASSVLACGAVPVFADINEINYCIDAASIKEKLSERTKAVMVVHIFGMPADMYGIRKVVKDYNEDIFIIEDAAQAPLAMYAGMMVGSIGDVGGFSFTESKHVMSGEGGIAVTNNERISNGLKYVRNHGEVNSLNDCEMPFFDNMVVKDNVGFNFRLTELAAALGNNQLDKLKEAVRMRRALAYYLDCILAKRVPALVFNKPRYSHKHSYYCYTLMWNHPEVSRDRFSEALSAEGVVFRNGYCQPIYKQHVYHDCPHWAIKDRRPEVTYDDLPMTEKVDSGLLVSLDVRSPNTQHDMQDIVEAICKVGEHIDELV